MSGCLVARGNTARRKRIFCVLQQRAVKLCERNRFCLSSCRPPSAHRRFFCFFFWRHRRSRPKSRIPFRLHHYSCNLNVFRDVSFCFCFFFLLAHIRHEPTYPRLDRVFTSFSFIRLLSAASHIYIGYVSQILFFCLSLTF